MLTKFSMKKSHHSNAKYSMWTERKLFPFSKTLSTRSYHSAVLHEDMYFFHFLLLYFLDFFNRIYIYGGYDSNSGSLSDFMHWEQMPMTGLSPGKLCRLASTKIKCTFSEEKGMFIQTIMTCIFMILRRGFGFKFLLKKRIRSLKNLIHSVYLWI